MKILVLGGHGFIGKRLVESLKKSPYKIISVSRKDGVDLANYMSAENCFVEVKPDIIINCAAHVGNVNYVTTYASDIIHDNVQMALNIYKAAAKVCPNVRIINPLSNCSYPGDSKIQEESNWLIDEVHDSVYSYGNSKRFIYIIAKCYNKQIGIDTINFLIPNTFGPGDYTDTNKTHALNGMIVRMIHAYRKGEKKFEIWGSGNPIREWAYVDDVVNILIRGIRQKKVSIYPINLAQNKGYSIRESAIMIKQAIGYHGELVFNTEYQDGAPTKILSDEVFRKKFPDFKFFNHREGIKTTVKYFTKIIDKEYNIV